MITDDIRDIIQEAGREAADFIKKNADNFGDKKFKGRVDMVTDIDLGAEKIILNKIRKHFPNHSIVTEESDNKDTSSNYRWIIDPLDGTTNFVHSFPFVAVSIGLEFNGEMV